ncbi:MAG: transglycosylase domain-containing protein [Spirochaetales bacterium]|nr:transglycosylase domain-containing protein [Spirochaetales bacterium]
MVSSIHRGNAFALAIEGRRILREQGRALARALDSGILALPEALAGSGDGSLRRRAPRPAAVFARKAWSLAWRSVALAHAFFVLTTSLLIACYAFFDPPVTVLAAYRKLQGWELAKIRPVSLAEVPRDLRRMVLAVEDYRFYEHFGIDPAAILNAMAINGRIGRPLYGGSTLTMQTARTLFLIPAKSYFRKYLEAIVTLELELILSKDRILELYFQWAEWGKGVFGVQAASYRWYGTAAARLPLDARRRLVALLSSPVVNTPNNLSRNRILASRYEFLLQRFGS